MLERAQLLQRFSPFERRRIERGEDEQGAAPVGVEADMSIERGPAAAGIAGVRNRGPRKVQRKAAAIDDHLHHVRIGQVRRIIEAVVEGRHRDRGVGKRLDGLGDGAGVEQRLVPLHVHDDVAVERPRNFGQPVGRAVVIGAREPHVAAEPRDDGRDAQIVGRDDDFRDDRRRGGAAVDVLDHRVAVDIREGLAGKP